MTVTGPGALVLLLAISLIVLWRYEKCSVAFENRYRTFWPRFWAGWVDLLVLWPFSESLEYIQRLDIPIWLFAAVLWAQTAGSWIYTVCLHSLYGQTLGKMVTRVRIFDARTNDAISFRHALLRDSIPIIILIPIVVYVTYDLVTMSNELPHHEKSPGAIWTFLVLFTWWAAEIVTMLTNDKRRAIHDFIAGTVVVRTNIEEPPEDTTPEPKSC